MESDMEYELITVRPGEDLTEVFAIRKDIFGFEEDDLDEIGISIVLKQDGRSIATGRIVLDMEADRLIIEQIGVAEDLRRQGIGTEVLDCLMNIAKKSEADEVWAKTKNNQPVMELLKKHGFDELNFYWMSVDMPYYK